MTHIHPRYAEVEDMVTIAGDQAGIELDPFAIVQMAIGSVSRGMALPWYAAKHKQIEAFEGGYFAVVEMVVGRAVALIASDPTLDHNAATWQAGNDWRAEIRSQWDERVPPELIHVDRYEPHIQDYLWDRYDALDRFDPDDTPVSPETMELLDRFSPREREALDHIADGVTSHSALASHLGIGVQGVRSLLRRIKERVQR